MEEQKTFIENNNVLWEDVGEGVRRKILAYDDKLMVVRVEFKKGSIGNIHQHYHSQITNVESGRFEVQINGNKQILNGGDAFYIPPHTDHGCVCLEDGVLIDVFSPMREDFVKTTGQAENQNTTAI